MMHLFTFYAETKDHCFKFEGKAERDFYLKKYPELQPITRAEALKKYGYTDSTSTRRIHAIHLAGVIK